MWHEILLPKLDHYGIQGSEHKFMQSFLKRKGCVSINGIYLAIELVTFVVAQGSTFIFALY